MRSVRTDRFVFYFFVRRFMHQGTRAIKQAEGGGGVYFFSAALDVCGKHRAVRTMTMSCD
ncbi:MAG: hypothetical protein DRH32_08725 [Deltaproteobacteria bacterium]|nr:MAG: hypothetical protein DRH32_08725 [Deltaproteobacteria bacterium]